MEPNPDRLKTPPNCVAAQNYICAPKLAGRVLPRKEAAAETRQALRMSLGILWFFFALGALSSGVGSESGVNRSPDLFTDTDVDTKSPELFFRA